MRRWGWHALPVWPCRRRMCPLSIRQRLAGRECTARITVDQEHCPAGPTPEYIGNLCDTVSATLTSNSLFCRYAVSNLKYLGGSVRLIFTSKPLCHTLSNAFVTSRNAAVQYCWFSMALLMTSTMRWHCCTVEWCPLKPNWWSGTHCLGSRYSCILLCTSFSRSFDIVGRVLLVLRVVRPSREAPPPLKLASPHDPIASHFPPYSQVIAVTTASSLAGNMSSRSLSLSLSRSLCAFEHGGGPVKFPQSLRPQDTREPPHRFSYNWIYEDLTKNCQATAVSIREDKSNNHFTWKHVCVPERISLIFIGEKDVSNSCGDQWSTRFTFNENFPYISLRYN
jgi:hypothetical protein